MKEPATRRPKELRTYLQAALRLYESLDYEQALEKLGRAKSYVRTLEDDALLSFYEGIILADLNRKEESKAAFRAGLLLKPDARLPMKVSPKVEQDFEAVRADVQRELASQQVPLEPEPPPEVVQQPPPTQEKQAATASSAAGADPARPAEARRPVLSPAPSTPGVAAAPSPRPRVLAYALMGGGVAVAGAGVFLGLSGLSFNERKQELTIDEAVKARATASTQLSAGSVLLGVGLAALGTGTVLLLLPGRETGATSTGPKTSLLLSPLPGGFALGSTGSF
jgi:tetratricopeptide (TPR) repeat protein